MTREEALEELDSLLIIRDGEQDKMPDAFEMAIKALKQEPCEDAISRQDLLDMAITLRDIANPDKEWEVVTVRTIKRLKSVTPKQRTGHNCNEDYADCDQFVCSECGIELQDWRRIERDEDDGEITCHEYVMKYCPNCGAKMEEQ